MKKDLDLTELEAFHSTGKSNDEGLTEFMRNRIEPKNIFQICNDTEENCTKSFFSELLGNGSHIGIEHE